MAYSFDAGNFINKRQESGRPLIETKDF